MSYQYKIVCRLKKLAEMRQFVRQTLTEMGISETCKNSLTLAIDEVCANVILHGHKSDKNHEFALTIKSTGPCVIFEIEDDGGFFDINNFNSLDIQKLVHEKRKGGLGIRLIKSIMDDITYEKKPNSYICRLTKKCT